MNVDDSANQGRMDELRERLAHEIAANGRLARQLRETESELLAILGSPAWRAVLKYRGWLRATREKGPSFFSLYERTIGRALTALGNQFSGSGEQSVPKLPDALSPRQLAPGNRGMSTDDHAYQIWIDENEPDVEELGLQRSESMAWSFRPSISVIVPVYRIDPSFLRSCVESVLNQTYDHWELCLAHAAPGDEENLGYLRKIASSDKRVILREMAFNHGISVNTNAALGLASGEFVAFLDHDDTLAPFALFSMAKHLNERTDADLIYSDHDYLKPRSSLRASPLFKPAWSPEIMFSACYVTHFTMVRRTLVDELGGFDPRADGAQDWDLFLRIAHKTSRIEHIAEVLYHWRIHSSSTALAPVVGNKVKPYVQSAQMFVLKTHMERVGMAAEPVIRPDGLLHVHWLEQPSAKVSIIIPTKDKCDVLAKCIASLLDKTRYENYEVLIIDTGSKERGTHRYYETLKGVDNIRVYYYPQKFNFSAVNNFGRARSTGELLLFLNNDIEITNETWLEELVHWAMYEPIGAVGAKLLHPNGKIQHAGVVIGLHGFADHPFAGQDCLQFGLAGSTGWYRNWLAVTGACLMMRGDVFDKIGGFDEEFVLCGSDVEICLRVWRHGYRVVLNPFAELIHLESATRGDRIPRDDFFVSEKHYAPFIESGDPYWNCNLSRWTSMPVFRRRSERTSRGFVSEYLESLRQTSGTR